MTWCITSAQWHVHPIIREHIMSDTEQPRGIDLGNEQTEETKDASANWSALDTPIEELEQRIAPTQAIESVSFQFTKIAY